MRGEGGLLLTAVTCVIFVWVICAMCEGFLIQYLGF